MQLTRVDLVSVSTVRQIGIVAARVLAALAAGLIVLAITCAPSKAGTISLPSNGSGVLSNLSFGTSYVSSRDTPVGTVLQSTSAAVGISASGMTCNATKTVSVNGTAVPGDPSTFQTNVPGIGVRFYITSMWANSWVQAPAIQTLSANNGGFAHYTRADLVVTGPVSAGTITTLPSMTVTFTGDCITTASTTQYLTVGSVITGRTCSVTTSSADVTLPKAFSSSLAVNGATTGEMPFALRVDCPAGVKVNVTLTDATNPSNRSTTLSLAQGSSASGVGLQILNGSTLVAYGPDSATAGNVNQWSAGTATGGLMQIPLSTRYVRTTGTLIPGSVKGLATFTMSYQ
ncbi:fimbrial protein [Paraburkholderia hospita]|jgi:type 1 fimbria pilin|uniref:fimbrial protein n=1 Tax=Paraburkholderia hospita TaxID=169430 RepID=UPI0012603618